MNTLFSPAQQPPLLDNVVENAHVQLQQRADQARAMGRQWMTDVRGTVRQHPVAAVATGLLAGALIAWLAYSRR